MITFLPYPDFQKSADCLDWQWRMNRLNNQINEGTIIAKTLLGQYEKGWPNHPTTLMWENCECLLVNYTWEHLFVWERKSKTHNQVRHDELACLQELAVKKVFRIHGDDYNFVESGMPKPWWLGDERLHSSHRAILLGKNHDWYKQFGWSEEPAVKGSDARWPYFWPVTKEGEKR